MLEIFILTIEGGTDTINDKSIEAIKEQLTEIGGNHGLSTTNHIRVKQYTDFELGEKK